MTPEQRTALAKRIETANPRVVAEVATWSIHGAQASERDVEHLAAEYLDLYQQVSAILAMPEPDHSALIEELDALVPFNDIDRSVIERAIAALRGEGE